MLERLTLQLPPTNGGDQGVNDAWGGAPGEGRIQTHFARVDFPLPDGNHY